MKRLKNTIACLAVAHFCLAMAACGARAADFTWASAGGGTWSTTADWTSDAATLLGYPSAADNVDIPGTLTGPVVLDIAAAANSMAIDDSATSLQISNSESLTIYNGLTNNGAINLSGGTALSSMLAFLGTQTISGAGNIVLGGYLDFHHAASLAFSGSLTQTANHTISGAGFIKSATSGSYFTNQGLINANVTGQYLVTEASTSNSGTMEVTNGGILEPESDINNVGGTILVTSGILEADVGINNVDGSILVTSGSVLVSYNMIGGTLAITGSSSLIPYDNIPTLTGITVAPGSQLNIFNGYAIKVANGLTNNGTIFISGGTGSTSNSILNFTTGAQTLSGSGSIVLGGYFDSQHAASLAIGGTFSQTASHTISGAGWLGNRGAIMFNQGLINANVNSQPLEIFSNLINSGTMEVTNGGILAPFNDIYNVGGTILGSGGTVEANITGGTVLSSGGTVQFRGCFFTGSMFATNGPYGIALVGGNLTGVTLSTNAAVTIDPSTTVFVKNGMINNGTIWVPGTRSGIAPLVFEGTETLSGIGSIVLGPGPTPPASAYLGFQSLTQAAGHTICGAGNIGLFDGESLANQGTINANVAGGTLAIGNITLTNSGTMEATNSGILSIGSFVDNRGGTILASGGTVNITGTVNQLSGGTLTGGTWTAQGGSPLIITSGGSVTTNQANVILDGAGSSFRKINAIKNNQGSFSLLNGQNFSTTGSLTNSGTIDVDAASSLTVAGSYAQLAGSTTIADGSLSYSGTMNVFGTVSGTGTLNGSVNIAASGTLAPGDAPGTITVAGNLILAGSAAYNWGLDANSADLTHVTGNLSFGSIETLNVSLDGTTLPHSGDYPLFLVDGTIGVLPSWTVNLPFGWTSGGIVQSGNEVLLTGLQPVPEPSSLALMAGGIAAASVWMRWRREVDYQSTNRNISESRFRQAWSSKLAVSD